MYNSFIFKKHSEQLEKQHLKKVNNKKWATHYKSSVRPVLVEKYSRRINNFITRLEEDKKDFYEYRQETEGKALELLKQLDLKERYLGQPMIKLRDNKDWASILSPTERIDKQRNKRIFESKYGDANIAYRSIASQSAYRPPDSAQFRSRDKHKEIHGHNMKFTSKARSFSENTKIRQQSRRRMATLQPSSSQQGRGEVHEYDIKRTNSNNSHVDDETKSGAFSVFSMEQARLSDGESSVSNNRQPVVKVAEANKNSNKVYFKQIVDLQQNSRDNGTKRSLQQILVRFGISRIKDIKKQAMVETDNLEDDQF